MKKRKPANFDYDFTGLAVEVTGDDLYLINGGAEVENSHQGVANAQVGDTITRSNGQVVVLGKGDIKYAQDQLGISGPATDAASPMPTPNVTHAPNVTIGGTTVASAATGMALSSIAPLLGGHNPASPRLTRKEMDKIMERNPGVYVDYEDLEWEWTCVNNNGNSGVLSLFQSIDSAALYWAKTYGDDSIVNGNELCSSIFAYDFEDYGATAYFYNKPLEGVNLETKRLSWISRKSGASASEITEHNIRAVSAIHSHGDGNEKFETEIPSKDDMNHLKDDSQNISSYIGKEYNATPGGLLNEFDESGITETISKDIPRDIRQDFEKIPGYTSEMSGFLFDLYKNSCYHPDVFSAYGTYNIDGILPELSD